MSPERLFCSLLLTLLCQCSLAVDAARARVTLFMNLNNNLPGTCDESAYELDVCAKEFTAECRHEKRYLQDACVASPDRESISFDVQHVDSPIEISGTVLNIGTKEVIALRPKEFLLTDRKEVTVSSINLLLVIRFTVSYECLPNYSGKLCNKFCDANAEEYTCDEFGNVHCNRGYFMDIKSGKCRKDQCLHMSSYCLNNSTCVNSQGAGVGPPSCLCHTGYTGSRCEKLVISSTTTINWSPVTAEPDPITTSSQPPPLDIISTEVHVPDGFLTTAPVLEVPEAKMATDAAPQGRNSNSRNAPRDSEREQEQEIAVKSSKTSVSSDKRSVDSREFATSKREAETSSVVQTAGISTGFLGLLIISITVLLVIVICAVTWYAQFRRRKGICQSGGGGGSNWSEPGKFSNWMVTCDPKQPMDTQHYQLTGECQPYSPSVLHPPPPFTPTYLANTETAELFPDQPWRSSLAAQPMYGPAATHVTTLPRVPRSLQLNTFLPSSGREAEAAVRQSTCYATPSSHYASSVHRQSRPPPLVFSGPGDMTWTGAQSVPTGCYGNPALVLPHSDYPLAHSPVGVGVADPDLMLTSSYLRVSPTTAYPRELEVNPQAYGSSQPDLDRDEALFMQSPVIGSILPPAPYMDPTGSFHQFQRTDI